MCDTDGAVVAAAYNAYVLLFFICLLLLGQGQLCQCPQLAVVALDDGVPALNGRCGCSRWRWVVVYQQTEAGRPKACGAVVVARHCYCPPVS
jgi:hypothetical protein